MHLKCSPVINARYWAAILIASAFGTNLGDLLKDICATISIDIGISEPRWFYLTVASSIGALLMSALFYAIIKIDNFSSRGNEAFYWIIILLIRAVATVFADLSGDVPMLALNTEKYAPIAFVETLVIGALLALLVTKQIRREVSQPQSESPNTNGLYWLTMLTAGILGTVYGDWVRDSAMMDSTVWPWVTGSVALIAVLRIRRTGIWSATATYWLAIVAVRWWGTGVGDCIAVAMKPEHGWVGGLWIGMAITGPLLLLVLFFWPGRRQSTMAKADYDSAALT